MIPSFAQANFNPHLRTKSDQKNTIQPIRPGQFQSTPSYEKGHVAVAGSALPNLISIHTFVREGTMSYLLILTKQPISILTFVREGTIFKNKGQEDSIISILTFVREGTGGGCFSLQLQEISILTFVREGTSQSKIRQSDVKISILTFVREGTRIRYCRKDWRIYFNPHLRTRRDSRRALPFPPAA